jgi:hypothetical protein
VLFVGHYRVLSQPSAKKKVATTARATVTVNLPSAKVKALGKFQSLLSVEVNDTQQSQLLCRVPKSRHLAKTSTLPSAKVIALSKDLTLGKIGS